MRSPRPGECDRPAAGRAQRSFFDVERSYGYRGPNGMSSLSPPRSEVAGSTGRGSQDMKGSLAAHAGGG